MEKLQIAPNEAGYSVSSEQETVVSNLDGGHSRYRRDIIKTSRLVNVTWTVSECDYQYLRSFYKSFAGSGGNKFTIDLIIDTPFLTEYTANFMPSTFRLTSIVAKVYTVSAQL